MIFEAKDLHWILGLHSNSMDGSHLIIITNER